MKKYLFLITISTMVFASCNNDLDMLISSIPDPDKVLDSKDTQMLSFATETDFLMAASNIDRSSEMTRSNSSFRSIYDEYMEASDIADEYYETIEGYEEFKKMYPNLYFPEYQNDYSFFLPVSDVNIAKLLNVDGNVEIGGNVISYCDIKTPEKLLEMGFLFPEKVFNNKTKAITPGDVNCINTKFHPDGDRRMSVSTYVENNNKTLTIIVNAHKAGPAGRWHNYKTKTNILGSPTWPNYWPNFSEQGNKRTPHVYTYFNNTFFAPFGGKNYCKVWHQGTATYEMELDFGIITRK